jgi:hypothetical protein
MGDPGKPQAHEPEQTIAAFDREREEAHELHRRHHEFITHLRRNDRIVGRKQEDHNRSIPVRR